MTKIKDKPVFDRKFLEFWGNLLLNIAKGQEQMERLSSLMDMQSLSKMDLMNFEEMAKAFSKSYSPPDSSPDKASDDDEERVQLKKSIEAFQKSFAGYLEIWGWVSPTTHEELKQKFSKLKKEHETLIKEHDSLKDDHDHLKKMTEVQEELISELRDLLRSKGMGHMELFRHLQSITRKQTSEFQNLVNGFSRLFDTGDSR